MNRKGPCGDDADNNASQMHWHPRRQTKERKVQKLANAYVRSGAHTALSSSTSVSGKRT
jgi:hypothetical protein